MVCLALFLRLGMVWLTQSHIVLTKYDASAATDRLQHYAFGLETGAVAGSLASGRGFASPFGGDTGPSAWVGPIYAGILALFFKIFGLYSVASCVAILTFNCLCSALTCIPMWCIGMRTVGRNATLIGGWIWTLCLTFMEWPTTWVWEMPLSALLLTLMVLLTLQLVDEESSLRWNLWGLVCGLATLTNPALCTCIVISGLWLVWRRWRLKRAWLQHTIVAACLCIMVISPWLVRNRMVFGQWVFLRSNFSFELTLGNYPNASGYGWTGKHPAVNHHVFEQYKEMGEVAFLKEKKMEAYRYMEEHPGEFLQLTASRVWGFWKGTYLTYAQSDGVEKMKYFWPWSLAMAIGLLAYCLKERTTGTYFALLLFLYPLPYYITYPQTRYRHAIEPIMLLLCGYMLSELWTALRQRYRETALQANIIG